MNFWNAKLAEQGKVMQSPSPAPFSKSAADELETRITDRFGRAKNTIDAGATVQGKVLFTTPTRIDGRLSGEVTANQSLVVGRTGEVNAQIKASSLIVIGRVKGDIEASERVEILAGGSVEGTITTPALVLEDGCLFNGTCTMRPRETKIVILEETQEHVESYSSSSDEIVNDELVEH